MLGGALDRSGCASGRRFLLIHLAASDLTTDTPRMAPLVLCACVGLRQHDVCLFLGRRDRPLARMFDVCFTPGDGPRCLGVARLFFRCGDRAPPSPFEFVKPFVS